MKMKTKTSLKIANQMSKSRKKIKMKTRFRRGIPSKPSLRIANRKSQSRTKAKTNTRRMNLTRMQCIAMSRNSL